VRRVALQNVIADSRRHCRLWRAASGRRREALPGEIRPLLILRASAASLRPRELLCCQFHGDRIACAASAGAQPISVLRGAVQSKVELSAA